LFKPYNSPEVELLYGETSLSWDVCIHGIISKVFRAKCYAEEVYVFCREKFRFADEMSDKKISLAKSIRMMKLSTMQKINKQYGGLQHIC